MQTQIFVMTHKAYQEQQDPVYRTLQVGRVTGDQSLPYEGDDTGENISDQNWLYGELTGFYWIWKNYREKDAVGICHYRRFFLNEEGRIMSGADYDALMSEYELIVPKPNISDQTNREGYAESHNLQDLLAVGDAVDKLSPDFSDAFREMLEKKSSYYANLCVMRHQDFDAYCGWMFAVLTEAGKKIDVSSYDNYHKRVYGFLSELLLNTWIIKKNYRLYEAAVGVTGEKAETMELKEKLAGFVRNGDYSGGRKCYYDFMEKRPDVRLANSDLTGEIPLMEIILYILEQEQSFGQKGFSGVSNDLSELVAHYRKVVEVLRALGDGSADEEMVQYILSRDLTAVAAEIILRNTAGINGDTVRKVLGIDG